MRSALTGLLMLLGCASTPASAVSEFPEECKLERQAILPFALDHGHIIVEVAVNGHPLHFMVDTAGAFSAISATASDAIGLHSAPLGMAYKIQDAGGAEVRRITRIEYLTLAKFRSENLTLMISDMPVGVDGILAPDLLRNFEIELDFATQTMTLFKQPRCSDHVVYWTDDFAKLPVRITEQGHIQISVRVNGQPLEATLDTGSPYTFIDDTAADAIVGPGKDTGKTFSLHGGQGGGVGGIGVAPDSLVIGKFKWLSPTLISTPNKSSWHRDGSEMLLGLDMLHDLHMFIDYKGRHLFVSRR